MCDVIFLVRLQGKFEIDPLVCLVSDPTSGPGLRQRVSRVSRQRNLQPRQSQALPRPRRPAEAPGPEPTAASRPSLARNSRSTRRTGWLVKISAGRLPRRRIGIRSATGSSRIRPPPRLPKRSRTRRRPWSQFTRWISRSTPARPASSFPIAWCAATRRSRRRLRCARRLRAPMATRTTRRSRDRGTLRSLRPKPLCSRVFEKPGAMRRSTRNCKAPFTHMRLSMRFFFSIFQYAISIPTGWAGAGIVRKIASELAIVNGA